MSKRKRVTKTGAIVRLKSGGPAMTVHAVETTGSREGQVRVHFFTRFRLLETHWFLPEQLVPWRPDPPMAEDSVPYSSPKPKPTPNSALN